MYLSISQLFGVCTILPLPRPVSPICVCEPQGAKLTKHGKMPASLLLPRYRLLQATAAATPLDNAWPSHAPAIAIFSHLCHHRQVTTDWAYHRRGDNTTVNAVSILKHKLLNPGPKGGVGSGNPGLFWLGANNYPFFAIHSPVCQKHQLLN